MSDTFQGLKQAALAAWGPLERRAGRAYFAGPKVADALSVSQGFWDAGMGVVICFWNGEGASPRTVANRCLTALEAFAEAEGDHYLAIKAPSLGFSRELVGEIVASAARGSVRVHFDAQRPEAVERTRKLAESVMGSGATIGFTLPGRFARSARDAAWAARRGLPVRVVKGQVPDPAAPGLDPRAGFLAVVDALAGKARHVGVASHDATLVREALERLVSNGTPCELELLLGLPFGPALREARTFGVPARIYVPFGEARLPYHITEARRNPRVFAWLARDLWRAETGKREKMPGWTSAPA
ncbi:hypothetical protein [Polyangium spumosum]|uniref:Proline dehydrogenase n=1 Tax=Polyangium spumosum TaxID=889282 RepID=A0A6N7PMR9_9BACT|nr:hypothetical protein [Polyangium spumosum]MRG93209.1 hypothetical protein [Polyangium spumosum]